MHFFFGLICAGCCLDFAGKTHAFPAAVDPIHPQSLLLATNTKKKRSQTVSSLLPSLVPLLLSLTCRNLPSSSVPPFRFKQYPLVAGLTIATVRGFLLNFGVYYAAREALGLPFLWSPAGEQKEEDKKKERVQQLIEHSPVFLLRKFISPPTT
jgi:hypothetical protein